MKELNEVELRKVDGGSISLKDITWPGIAIWLITNWSDVKNGISDGWTEIQS